MADHDAPDARSHAPDHADYQGTEMPTYLDPAKVGAAVVRCPGCGQERWYGYGACGRCETYLPSEEKPALTGEDAIRLMRERDEWLRG